MRNRLQYTRLTEGKAIDILTLSGICVNIGEKTIASPGSIVITSRIEDAFRSMIRRGYRVQK